MVDLIGRPQIKTFWLVLTYQCNNRCAGCYAHDSGFRNEPMTRDLAVKIMTMMKRLGAKDCLLIGGEPTLYHKLPELIEDGTTIGIDCKLVSNGRKLKDKKYLARLITAGLTHVSISIEGAVAETHNSVVRTNSFHETMAAIENSLDLGLSFNTLLTISRQTVAEVIPLAKRVSGMGVKNILFNVGLPSPGLGHATVSRDDFVLDPAAMAKFISEAYVELKNAGIKAKFFATIPLCLIRPDLLETMIKDDYISNGTHCHIYYGSGAVFEPNGNVLPCTHFVGRPLFNIFSEGITTVDDFTRVWYDESNGMHGSFKRTLWKYPSEKCKTCQYWGKCVGGCPFLWSMFKPSQVIG